MRPFRLFAVVLTSSLFAACTPPMRTAPRLAPGVSVRLVDSIPWSDELGEGVLHRVEVRAGSRVDTIPGLATAVAPLVVGGTRLMGFVFENDAITSGFDYDVPRRSLRMLPLPEDFNRAFSMPGLSPDGAHIAYVALPGDGTGSGVVRTWPAGALVYQSARVEVPATDALGGNLARWLSDDAFEIFVETGPVTDTAWLRLRGSVRARTAAADTVSGLPLP